jgi:hypothetical protein
MSNSLELYSTAAQVIPLLLGFLAFELRSFALREAVLAGPPSAKALPIASSVLVIMLLALGEVAAVSALGRGMPSQDLRLSVLTALFAGGLALLVGLVERILEPLLGEGSVVLSTFANALIVVGVAGWLLFA